MSANSIPSWSSKALQRIARLPSQARPLVPGSDGQLTGGAARVGDKAALSPSALSALRRAATGLEVRGRTMAGLSDELASLREALLAGPDDTTGFARRLEGIGRRFNELTGQDRPAPATPPELALDVAPRSLTPQSMLLAFGEERAIDLDSPASQFVFEVRGAEGTRELSFSSGATISQIADAINGLSADTGVRARLTEGGGPGIGLVLTSTSPADDGGFVSVRVLDSGGLDPEGDADGIYTDGDPKTLVRGNKRPTSFENAEGQWISSASDRPIRRPSVSIDATTLLHMADELATALNEAQRELSHLYAARVPGKTNPGPNLTFGQSLDRLDSMNTGLGARRTLDEL